MKKARKIEECYLSSPGTAPARKSRIDLKKQLSAALSCYLIQPIPLILHHQIIIFFLPMKKQLRGHKFKDDDEAKHAVKKVLEEFLADFF